MPMKSEQVGRRCAHLERILLVCGEQNAGKSTALRSMYRDLRFGTKGKIPTASILKPIHFSQERALIIRCTSPHEAEETLDEFIGKIDNELERAWSKLDVYRMNYASAVQPNAINNMPDIIETCRAIHDAFWPERIRLVQLHPRQDGTAGQMLSPQQIEKLRKWRVEVVTIDGSQAINGRTFPNAMFLASFFDFI